MIAFAKASCGRRYAIPAHFTQGDPVGFPADDSNGVCSSVRVQGDGGIRKE
jgi:hypothetical protein